MLTLGQSTTIHCPLGLWVLPSPFSLSRMNFTGCPYQCALGHYGNTSQEKDFTCSGECDRGGQYCPAATVQPLLCPAGTYLPVGVAGLAEASCIPCAPGAYNPDEGSASCLTCPAGKLSENVSSTKCSDCPRGGSCSAEAAASLRQTFTPCPAGTFNPYLGQKSSASCQACAPGKASTITGSSDPVDCRNCSAGFVAAASGAAFCDGCAAGKYQAGEGEQACVACEPGSFCPQGTSAALPCKEGSYSSATNLSSAGECTTTTPGFYASTGSTQQIKCSPGTVAPRAEMGACNRCAAGSFQGKEGNQTCEPCPISSWCAPGSSAPTACEAGKVGRSKSLSGASGCEACPMGSWCSAGLEAACGVNTYQPRINQNYTGACQQCPEFAVSNESSKSVGDCKCQQAYYDNEPAAGNVSCKPCPIGSECKGSGGTLALLPLVPGYWRTNDGSSDLRRCPDASSPDRTACANTKGVPCKPWTTGPYCRVCNVTDGSQYFDSGQSACVQCGDTTATSLTALVGITLAMLLLLCWCSRRQPCKRLRSVVHQALQKLRAPLKQMVAFYQARDAPATHARTTHSFTPFVVPLPAPSRSRHASRASLRLQCQHPSRHCSASLTS